MTADRAETAAVLIAGPTASGKSALAAEVARRSGAVIVNADSMQVYRELAILTARPTAEDEAALPHRLYGTIAASHAHTVAEWLADLAAVADEAAGRRVPLVIVGGTGLYFSALTRGLSVIPSVPGEIRERMRERGVREGAAALHAELAQRDPLMAARLRPTDTQRVVRALEVLEATGRSLADFQGARAAPVLPRTAIRAAVVLAPVRDALHSRIEARFQAMLASSGLEEARRLDALGLPAALPAMKAIGVPEMIAAVRGELALDAAIEAAVTATRRYAKRQETWFRNQMPDWSRIEPRNIVAAADRLAQLLKKGVDQPSRPD